MNYNDDREYCEECDAMIEEDDFDCEANLCNDCADLKRMYDEDEEQ